MKRFDKDNMYKQIKLPVSDITADDPYYSTNRTLFDNYIVKQACCTGMPSGKDHKYVPMLLPSKDPAKLRNGEYEEVQVKVTKADCAKLDGSAQEGNGYNLRSGDSTSECTNFARLFCQNLSDLNGTAAACNYNFIFV